MILILLVNKKSFGKWAILQVAKLKSDENSSELKTLGLLLMWLNDIKKEFKDRSMFT